MAGVVRAKVLLRQSGQSEAAVFGERECAGVVRAKKVPGSGESHLRLKSTARQRVPRNSRPTGNKAKHGRRAHQIGQAFARRTAKSAVLQVCAGPHVVHRQK